MCRTTLPCSLLTLTGVDTPLLLLTLTGVDTPLLLACRNEVSSPRYAARSRVEVSSPRYAGREQEEVSSHRYAGREQRVGVIASLWLSQSRRRLSSPRYGCPSSSWCTLGVPPLLPGVPWVYLLLLLTSGCTSCSC